MMRQLSLDPSTAALTLKDVPQPAAPGGGILVRTAYSVISTGTELTKVDLAGKSLLDKARERPDQVAKVLDAVRTEGIVATVRKVRERLASPQPLGYSLAGTVVAVGNSCEGFAVRMRVACGGVSASHAELVAVPGNLAVPVPDGVPLDEAAFATIGSVALHGLRCGGVSIGDRVLVIGLGLVGQLSARLCVAAGAHVFGLDPRSDRVALALAAGVERGESIVDGSVVRPILDWSGGRGADVVLITAGGGDDRAITLAAAAARDRAKIVAVGAVSLNLPREAFFEKELDLVISRSYGPGRYDPDFEEKGMAYPVGYVPWTERRNMEEILNLLADRRLSLHGLREETVPFEQAAAAYAMLGGEDGPSPIAVTLEYPSSSSAPAADRETVSQGPLPEAPEPAATTHSPRALQVSFIGMGNFATGYLLPAVKSIQGVSLSHVVTSSSLKAENARSRSGFRVAGTSAEEALRSPGTQVVFIATRHSTHTRFVEAALIANKAVFVEKPLALTKAELDRVVTAIRATQGRLMVGFNRRFAPATALALKALGTNRAGLRFLCRVNAGALPEAHWLLDPEVGGGRLLGEACHFIDLATYVAGAAPLQVEARALDYGIHAKGNQDFHIEVEFANGATAAIEYLSGGDSSLPKEYMEIHRSGLSIAIDDFRSVAVHRAGRRTNHALKGKDKGHRAEVVAFLEAVRTGGPTPIPEEETITSTALTLAAARSAKERRAIPRREW